MQLTEQYRPQAWADVVGQDKIVQRVRALAKRGLAGRAYWISGQSGTGKTTIARLIAAEVADELLIREVDAAGLTVSALRDLEVAGLFPVGAGERALLVTEQLGLDQRVRNRRAIDRDERLRASRAHLMERSRYEFLAGTGLTRD